MACDAFFPYRFKLSKQSCRAFQIFLDIPVQTGPQGPAGPQGPQGPAGPGVVAYSTTPVLTGRTLFGVGELEIYVIIDSSEMPNGNETNLSHGITDPFLPISIFGAAQTEAGDVIPLPYPGSASSGLAADNLSVRLDADRVYLSSDGDFTSFVGALVIRYIPT